MQEFEAWVADCHLLKAGSSEEFQCRAAIWANGHKLFRSRLTEYFLNSGYSLLWLEECLPAAQYVARHGQQNAIGSLARGVHEGHPVELSQITGRTDEGDAGQAFLTVREHEIAPLMDQSEVSVWDREWISPDLKMHLFGQPEENLVLRTYFIVDATLRKNITGVFDLSAVDVPVRCLFKEGAAESMKEAAPYLIDMTLPPEALEDRDAVPAFHRDFFQNHWGQNTGIFIRTTGTMEDVWKHFRKFTRAQVETDHRWVFFRFWDPRIAVLYFRGRVALKNSVEQWFSGREISLPEIFCEVESGKRVVHFQPDKTVKNAKNTTSGHLILTNDDLKPFVQHQNNKMTDKVVTLLRENFGNALKHLSDELLQREVTQSLQRMQKYGVSKFENLYLTSAWAAFYGHNFETKDPAGELLRICQSDLEETDKMKALRERITQMKPKGDAA